MNMLSYRSYCHETSHIFRGCAKRRSRRSCWDCGVEDHIAAECVRYKPNKKARKTAQLTKEVARSCDKSIPAFTQITPDYHPIC